MVMPLLMGLEGRTCLHGPVVPSLVILLTEVFSDLLAKGGIMSGTSCSRHDCLIT